MVEDYFGRCFDLEKLRQKKIYVFGVSVLAIAAIKYLCTHGRSVCGFSDFSFQKAEEKLKFSDTQIFMLKTMEGRLNGDCIAIIACTRQRETEKYEKWIKNCSAETEIIILDNQSEAYIDVSGRCNLRCYSCQVYNHDPESFSYTGRTEMSKQLFCDVLDKIQKEIFDIPGIFLFIFGEPLLARNLPFFINEIHKRGMIAIISTNLSLNCDLENILLTEPEVLKISVSGFSQAIYETTHNGGNIELVKSNMCRIREIIDKHGLKTNVMVGYHIYNNNADECRDMADLCKKLSFLFQPRRASYCNIPKQSGMDEYSEADRVFIKKYYSNWQDILNTEYMDIPQEGECNTAKNKLFIDYDGNVMLCYLVMHKLGVYKSYLEVSLDDIRRWQSENRICYYCKRVGLASIN